MNFTPNIKALGTLVSASALLLLSGNAAATTSSEAELRGFNQCLSNVQGIDGKVVTPRTYLMKKTATDNHYFINLTTWVDGERTPVRVSCRTDHAGRTLLSQDLATGTYVSAASRNDRQLADR